MFEKLEHYKQIKNALEAYAIKKDLNLFENMIAQLEEEQLDKYLSMSGSEF